MNYREVVLNQRIRTIDCQADVGKEFVLSVAKKARKAYNYRFAELCLASLRNKESPDLNVFELKVQLEEAQLLWARGETYIARYE